jgi:hypothetical protein
VNEGALVPLTGLSDFLAIGDQVGGIGKDIPVFNF